MHKTASEATAFVRRLAELVPAAGPAEVVLAPPFTALHATAHAGALSRFTLSAQNLFWEDEGPYTGEVSASMLKDLGCRYVIVGHSERRMLFGERDEGINRKVRAALQHGLRPILCLGETLPEREGGRTDSVVKGQLLKGLEGVPKEDVLRMTVAYEPVWAIGTGRAATAAQAADVHATLRSLLAGGWGAEAGEQVRILYGGSVTPDNASEFLASSEVDGALVGGACLDPQSFARIIAAAEKG
jgi:triosephosphate isomerase